jgi:predicted ferric reductase
VLKTRGFWLALYLGAIVLPLLVLLAGERPQPGGFWWDFSLALGYSALAMMGIQFALTARFKRATAPFGIDLIYYFHRYLATIATLLVVAHALVLLWRHPAAVGSVDPRSAPAYMTLGWLALFAFLLLVVSSLWRKQLGIEYDRWRRLHVALAVLGLVFAIVHVLGAGSYLESPLKRGLWLMLAAFWLGLTVYVRTLRPAWLARRPWVVTDVRKERGRSWTLAVKPDGTHPVFDYHPGAFAWLTLRASPWAMREHPFSIASSPMRPGALEFTIKELGDFTNRIGEIKPGERAWVDGPYGSFGIDRFPNARGYIFVAGGVGIAPLISMLRALDDRGDRRLMWLFYGNSDYERIVLREEIDAIAERIGLKVVHVLCKAGPDWQGERGYVDAEVMRRHLPEDLDGLECFVCGPEPMIRLAERSLGQLGLPLARVHSEIFDIA